MTNAPTTYFCVRESASNHGLTWKVLSRGIEDKRHAESWLEFEKSQHPRAHKFKWFLVQKEDEE